MPIPGDQHRPTAATTNPFLEQKQHISDYSAAEIATLQSRLEKQLGPEYVSTRPGAGGGKVHYLAAEKAINLANEVFGFNGWSSSIQNVQIDFVDENPQNGKITLGLSTIVRVTIRDGTFHEDIGYGHIENCKGKAAAFEKAKKEAATDALKRALRNFGNVLGNCLYDKDYLQKVQRIKVRPSRWDGENLHRHPDFAPIKLEAHSVHYTKAAGDGGGGQQRQSSAHSGASYGSMEFEDDFGGNPFEEVDFGHPDEVMLDDTSVNGADTPVKKPALDQPPQNPGQQRQGVPRMHSMPQMRPPNVQSPAPMQNPQAPQRPQGPPRPPTGASVAPPGRMAPPPQQKPAPTAAAPAQQNPDTFGNRSNPSSATATSDSSSTTTPQQPPRAQNQAAVNQPAHGPDTSNESHSAPRMPPPGNPDGFVTGRSAELLNQPPGARPPNGALPFNPHAETPSIRRTQGVNPGKSVPITRSILQQQQQQGATNATAGMQNGGQPQQAQQQASHQRQQSPAPAAALNGFNGVTTPVRTNFVNPSADQHRRIGMPSAGGHNNRSAYKPPSIAPGGAHAGVKRPPLSDVSNIQQMDGTGDAKKAKLDGHADKPAPEGVGGEENIAAVGEPTS